MPWLKSGDNAATYPALLALAYVDDADERLRNEVSGWLWRCAMQSAGHTTDGQIDAGTADLMGGARTPILVQAALEAGLLTPIEGARPPRWQLIEDPEFIHIRSKESVEFDRQRDRDRKNTGLTAPVRFRDGDACRYCGLVVNFGARTGGRAGTYDHLDPGKPATVETYVVACRSCNSKKQDGGGVELLTPPDQPFYHPATIEWLHKHGLTPASHRSEPARADEGVTPGGHRRTPARPAPVEDTAAQRDPDTAGSAATRTPQPSATLDSAETKRSPADVPPWEELDQAPCSPSGPGRIRQDPPAGRGGIPVGSGRDGTGQDGKGLAGSGRDGPGRGGSGAGPPRGGRRRRSRGRRSRKRGGER